MEEEQQDSLLCAFAFETMLSAKFSGIKSEVWGSACMRKEGAFVKLGGHFCSFPLALAGWSGPVLQLPSPPPTTPGDNGLDGHDDACRRQ